MNRLHILLALLTIIAMTSRALAVDGDLIARWDFDKDSGDVVTDGSGNGRDGKLVGGARVPQAGGAALELDGFDDHVDFGSGATLGAGGPISVELWLKPTRKPHGEAVLFGEGFDSSPIPNTSILLTFYNGNNVYWYIGDGGNSIRGEVEYGAWSHVVATFDGKQMRLWINGRMASERESKYTKAEPRGKFVIGSRASDAIEKFKGLMDDIRVYGRALSKDDVLSRYRESASGYRDITWATRLRTTLYLYPQRNEVVIESDFSALDPQLSGSTRLEITVAAESELNRVLATHALSPVPARTGLANVTIPCAELPAGKYVAAVTLTDDRGALPTEKLAFTLPLAVAAVPAPSQVTAGPLAPPLQPTNFTVQVGHGGGFTIRCNGAEYPFRSRVSWPNGEFNRLAPDDKPDRGGEKSWKVTVRKENENRHIVQAAGSHYTIDRVIDVLPTHVMVRDTYKNTMNVDLGLLVYNETPVSSDQVRQTRLSGYDRRGRQAELSFPHYSLFSWFADARCSLGIVPMDDVYVLQAVPYVDWEGAAGVGTEKLAIAPGSSYTLQWAVYPVESGDYYDFVNTFRKAEDRIGTVQHAPGYTSYSLRSRRQVPDEKFVADRNLGIGIIPCIYNPADDADKNMEGIEFIDFPKERELLLQQTTAIKRLHPGFKMVFHLAHSLFATNDPERFGDSKVIGPDGKQATWGGGEYFGKYGDEGWRYYIFYPTPGNKFHDAMMKAVDVMMDDMGFDGPQMDGFFAGYGGLWTYDRWDGHSADIDRRTKTITRKLGSVLLLSQPSLIEFARKIRDKGGVIIGMHTVFTPSMAREKYILFSDEDTGPGLHLAPNMIPLSKPGHRNEKEMYQDMLEKLSWGEMFTYYSEPTFFSGLTYPSLASKQFPITFEEIRGGMVKGKERIVTMNSGVYGWHNDRRLHFVHHFDGRGAPAPTTAFTTVDSGGVRTDLRLGEDESAVIEPTAALLEASAPLNARVLQDDDSTFRVRLHGTGQATIRLFVGSSWPAAKHDVAVGGEKLQVAEVEGVVAVPVTLSGPVEVSIDRTRIAQ